MPPAITAVFISLYVIIALFSFFQIYAGNMAAILEKSFLTLQDDPKRVNGEICYCVDSTKCLRIYDVPTGGMG